MNCEVTIQVATYPDAVYVPVQCVVRVNRQPVVFIDTPAGPVLREVAIGADNDRMVHILDGLQPGEPVLLAPPLDTLAKSPDSDDGDAYDSSMDLGNEGVPQPVPAAPEARSERTEKRARRQSGDGAERRQRPPRSSQEQP